MSEAHAQTNSASTKKFLYVRAAHCPIPTHWQI